jgi:hypothetical protein
MYPKKAGMVTSRKRLLDRSSYQSHDLHEKNITSIKAGIQANFLGEVFWVLVFFVSKSESRPNIYNQKNQFSEHGETDLSEFFPAEYLFFRI